MSSATDKAAPEKSKARTRSTRANTTSGDGDNAPQEKAAATSSTKPVAAKKVGSKKDAKAEKSGDKATSRGRGRKAAAKSEI